VGGTTQHCREPAGIAYVAQRHDHSCDDFGTDVFGCLDEEGQRVLIEGTIRRNPDLSQDVDAKHSLPGFIRAGQRVGRVERLPVRPVLYVPNDAPSLVSVEILDRCGTLQRTI
jgi:hypothetical protein